jgi:hypothetical protein
LYAVAIFIRFENYDNANYLLDQKYYLHGNSDYGRDVMVGYTVFIEHMKSLEHRNARLKLRRTSLRADFIKERCTGVGIEFRHLLQADFVIFMRSEIEEQDNFNRWWPETLIYLGNYHSTFEIFARSISKKYFDRVKVLLSINEPLELEDLLQSYKEGSRTLPRWDYQSFSPSTLLGHENLATRP